MDTNLEISKTSVLSGDAATPDEPQLQIAGYTLEKSIGAGGYGEVWKAIGPGGFAKAVKILHGKLDGQQAEIELKSLERVRELRHPFLMNIERIEVCDGKLIVVSELADTCMEKRFKQAREEGLKGIPREELLGYLRDAADALDFMLSRGGLQHLDIKPANILLLGDHAKVGDFGLTKDVTAAGVSMLGGFTPLYSAPEIFEGQPSRQSDQYSLAIVYQTMLTGEPPFAGRTAAQLTAQHLSSTPDLTSLAPADRPVVARALSKNPQARFSGCREFVDALSRKKVSSQSYGSGGKSGYESLPAVTKSTRVVNAETMAAAEDDSALEIKPIQPDNRKELSANFRPTLVLAVGGLGGQVLSFLKQELRQSFAADSLKSFPLVYLDTDSRALRSVRADGYEPGLADDEVLQIPLRSSKELRTQTDKPLKWLSRRWLFNIPKTGQVEGMRPLGRLALVDQQERVRQHILESIQTAIAEESVAETCEATRLQISAGPIDVVLVASTSGGTGSGAVLDLSYLVREVSAANNIELGSVTGVLLHGTGTTRQANDVQQACTVSLLRELQHYNTPGLKEPRGVAPTETEARPFDHSYLIHLGDELSDQEFAAQLRTVGDYLFHTLVTPARANFLNWRERDGDPNSDISPTAVRTFGISAIEEDTFKSSQIEAERFCNGIVSVWTRSGQSESTSPAEPTETRDLLAEFKLSPNELTQSISAAHKSEAGQQLHKSAVQYASQLLKQCSGTPEEQQRLLVRLANALLKNPKSGDPAGAASLLPKAQQIFGEFVPTVGSTTGRLEEQLSLLLDSPGRFALVEAALGQILGTLDAAARGNDRTLSSIANAIKAYCQPSQTAQPVGIDTYANQLVQLCEKCCEYAIYQAAKVHLSQIQEELAGVASQVLALRGMVARIEKDRTSESAANIPTNAELAAFDKFLLSSDAFRLRAFLETGDPAELWKALRQAATAFWRANSLTTEEESTEDQSEFPASAHPGLKNTGGWRHVVAVLPPSAEEETWRAKLQEEFGDCVSTHQSDKDKLTVCCEVDGIEISHIVKNFLRYHPHLAEVAQRIHVRNDISW